MALAMENFKKKRKMKQLIITTILSLLMIHCKGQQNDNIKPNNLKNDTMNILMKIHTRIGK